MFLLVGVILFPSVSKYSRMEKVRFPFPACRYDVLLQLMLFSMPTGTPTVSLTLPFTLLPSAAVAVMFTVPWDTAVTTPFSSTVATFSLADCQVTAWAASAGSITAVSRAVL